MAHIYGYGRHSTGKQGITEAVQREQIDRYCEAMLLPKGDLELGNQFWFYDKATSGTKPLTDREEGLKLWVTAQPGDHIVIAKLDRAFRSVLDGVKTIQMFKAKGVNLHILDVHIDTSTPIGEFIVTVMLAFAQLQQRYISERTREIMAHKRAKGEGCGKAATTVPIGWRRYGKKNPFIVPFEAERQLIDEMARMRDEGMTYPSIYQTACNKKWNRKGRVWVPDLIKLALLARDLGYPKLTTRKLRSLLAAQAQRPDDAAQCEGHAAAGEQAL
jgi:DNA invertase Pin-like site-specific DNA recombinase